MAIQLWDTLRAWASRAASHCAKPLLVNGPPLALIILCIGVQKGILEPMEFERKAAQCKQNLHAIQLALERYAVDSPNGSTYPADITELKRSGYLPSLPLNPFSEQPMRAYAAGEDVPLGDFIYYPRYKSGATQPDAFTLASGNAAGATEWMERIQQ